MQICIQHIFSGYHIESTKKSLAEARVFCKNLGQKLFEPKSLEADNEVNQLVKAQGHFDLSLFLDVTNVLGNQGILTLSAIIKIIKRPVSRKRPIKL